MNPLRLTLGLKREAVLLDSWLYILKSMAALSVGFLLGNAFSITRLDMISVLLGVMYNLEATNVSGIRGGLNQLLASSLGAIITGFLVYLMGFQVNALTVALGMGLTLYVALKIDYRMVSPVAIFTSIYMTQFIQRNALGDPSILLTFRLRIAALGLGVGIAILFNYIFSFFYYRKIGRKRLEFVKLQCVIGLKRTVAALSDPSFRGNPLDSLFAGIFSDIEMVKSNVETMGKESIFPFNQKEKEKLAVIARIIRNMKILMHLAYDANYVRETFQVSVPLEELEGLRKMSETLDRLDFTQRIGDVPPYPYPAETVRNANFNEDPAIRIQHNLNLMELEFKRLLEQAAALQ